MSVPGRLSDYGREYRLEIRLMAVVSQDDIWVLEREELRFRRPDSKFTWRFHGGELDLSIDSPRLTADLHMTGASQVMWAKDT